MAKSYKSALPTWTTYTPYMGPVATQGAINQEVFWRNRARQWTPPSVAGAYNRIAADVHASVRGTGAAQAVAGALQHRPLTQYLEQRLHARAGGDDPRSQWYRRMQEAVQQGTPEAEVAPGEATPQTPTQVRVAHTAPSSVNPADVVQQVAARQTVAVAADAVLSSPEVGTATTGPVIGTRPKIFIDQKRG